MTHATTTHRKASPNLKKGGKKAGNTPPAHAYPVEHTGNSNGASRKARSGKQDRKGILSPSEHAIQKHCVAWFAFQYPHLEMLLFAIPNGGHRTKAVAGKMKAEGVKKGVADLFLSVPAKGKHGLYIEMKTHTGRQSSEQIFFEQNVFAMGYEYRVCRSLEDFQEVIKQYLP